MTCHNDKVVVQGTLNDSLLFGIPKECLRLPESSQLIDFVFKMLVLIAEL